MWRGFRARRVRPTLARIASEFTDVGRADAKLTGKSALRGAARAAFKVRLPGQKLDNPALAFRAKA